MKRLMAVLFCVSVIFTFGCSQTDSNKETAQESTESAVSMGVVERTTEEWSGAKCCPPPVSFFVSQKP